MVVLTLQVRLRVGIRPWAGDRNGCGDLRDRVLHFSHCEPWWGGCELSAAGPEPTDPPTCRRAWA